MTRYVEVAVNVAAVNGTFHYHVPPELQPAPAPGHLVSAPFGEGRVHGIVIDRLDKPAVSETRPIEALIDPDPVLQTSQLELARWISNRTMSPIIDTLSIMLPPGLTQKADRLYTLRQIDFEVRNETQKRLQSLFRKRGPMRGRQISRALPRTNWQSTMRTLVKNEIVTRESVLDPPRVRPGKIRTARLAVSPQVARNAFGDLGRTGGTAAQRRRLILEALIAEREPLDLTWVYAETGGTRADLTYLEDRGLILLSDAEIWRDPLEEIEYVLDVPPQLTVEQKIAWEAVQKSLDDSNGAKPLLLHGVTGSGKTEIYLRAAAQAMAQGKGVIVLVPEISLTPQTVRRFLARFPGEVGLIHSQLSEGERYDTWRRCRAGLLRLVIGPRSALFAPLPDIGLIVVDESHDASYKEASRSPRYHARDTAVAYAHILGATCLLGSATPDVVTFWRAEQGNFQKVVLPQRILGHQKRLHRQAQRFNVQPHYRGSTDQVQTIDMPPVQIVDMREELKAGNSSLFSQSLQLALIDTLKAEQQAILFLNRRGNATYVFCRDCGWVARCPQCDNTLTHHHDENKLICHHCGYRRGSREHCPQCGGTRVRHFGAGTQRIESELHALLPQVQSIRWDSDTASKKGAHEVILAHFAAHRADVLIGTQMVAKGLDLPMVTLVGVVSADTELHLPDYRAAERTFQLLTQVAGRAGRGLLGGQVILQTYHPEHFAIQAASRHDYETFYVDEIESRRVLRYPPFARLAQFVYQHTRIERAEEESRRLAQMIRQQASSLEEPADIVGPTPAYRARLRGLHRWQFIVRAADPTQLIPKDLPKGWLVDIDPVSLLK